ncbi:nucleotide-binding alpha-beta plait domain-containing protein [Tanacetum coccineum]
MGACMSSAGDSIHKSTDYAFVISTKGELRQYPTPIFVSEVLQYEKPSFFVCNSDNLYQDQDIPCMDSEDELDAGQIYFILPKTMLARCFSTSDMASLAVKASLALDSNSNSNSHVKKKKNNNARISPMVLLENRRGGVSSLLNSDKKLLNMSFFVRARFTPCTVDSHKEAHRKED